MAGHGFEKGFHTLEKTYLPNGKRATVLIWNKEGENE